MNKRPLDYYFSKKELLKILSRKRALLAKKEHDKLFHKRLLLNKGSFNLDTFYSNFPPRKEWIRLQKKERKNKSALDINAIQIERTVLKATRKFKNPPSKKWELQLYDYIYKLSNDVLASAYKIPKPKVIPQFKDSKNGISVFRPIAHFSIIDRIKISQISKYLTDCFDSTFEDCSYAFRSTRILGKSISHHTAVEDIINYKKDFSNRGLWVSECDIKKFFDCVNHDVVKKVFEEKVIECLKKGLIIDNRAIEIFYSYLDSYAFNIDVLSLDLGKNKEFGWVSKEDLLKIKSNPESDRIGVPQGGAISCLIANLLMDYVDKKVIAEDEDGKLFYARFCDDMVLMHPDKVICERALNAYINGLKEMKLLHHHFTKIKSYNKEFWKSKSKAPYLWDKLDNSNKKSSKVPWLSFVGYQVNSDLKIRVRRSSLEKEIQKQVRETGKVISLIKSGKDFRVSESSIERRLKQRLLSMSVGRINIFDFRKVGQMCWTSGFRLLNKYDYLKYQAKHLDKKRVAQFCRLESRISRMDETQRPEITRKAIKIVKDPKYYGSPFSYHFQFKK